MLKCRHCGKTTSLLLGTLFERSRVPMDAWIKVIKEMTHTEGPVSASAISRTLDLRRPTILHMVSTLRQLIEARHPVQLRGCVQVDEYLLPFRSASGTIKKEVGIFVAVEKRDSGTGLVALQIIDSFHPQTLIRCLLSHIAEGSIVETDGLAAYAKLSNGGFKHRVVRKQASVGTNLLPTCRAVAEQITRWLQDDYGAGMKPEHLGPYLAEFAFRLSYTGPNATAHRRRDLLRWAVEYRPPTEPDLRV